MSILHYYRHIGVRFSQTEYDQLQQLVRASGHTQSVVIRFLVRTAANRPDIVAHGINRDRDSQRHG